MQGGRKIDELQVCTNQLNPLLIFFKKELYNFFFPFFFLKLSLSKMRKKGIGHY